MKLRATILSGLGLLAISASALASPADIPTVFTSYTLEASTKASHFKGKIDSPKSKCVSKRKVKLIRKHNGNTDALGHDETGDRGKFNIELSRPKPKKGKYYAKVKQKKIDNGGKTCLSVTSGSVTVS